MTDRDRKPGERREGETATIKRITRLAILSWEDWFTHETTNEMLVIDYIDTNGTARQAKITQGERLEYWDVERDPWLDILEDWVKLSPSAIGYPDDGRELIERYLADEQRDMPAQEKQ